MSGYWVDSPDNPFNQMSWTRGGGGYDNAQTHESNERRASAMSGAGASALPHYATASVGIGQVQSGGQFVANDLVYQKGKAPAVHVPGAGGGQTAGQAVNVASGNGKRSGSALQVPEGVGPVRALPASGPYLPGFSPGVIDWQSPKQFENAPKVTGIKNVPLERIGIGGAQEAPGAISDVGWIRTTTGAYIVTPSSDAKERIEDDLLQQGQWSFRNQILPAFMLTPQPFPDFLEPEYSRWSAVDGGWKVGANPRRGSGGDVWLTGGGF